MVGLNPRGLQTVKTRTGSFVQGPVSCLTSICLALCGVEVDCYEAWLHWSITGLLVDFNLLSPLRG
jgi:hypothetical protein